MPPLETYIEETEAWRRQKDEDLRGRDSWLALAGLFWLDEGVHTVGSAPDAHLPLPFHALPRLGTFIVRAGEVRFLPAEGIRDIEGAPLPGDPMRPDTAEEPHFLRHGEVTLMVIERGGRLGIRVWDNDRPERRRFPGRSWFPIDPSARIAARFESAASGETIAVPNQLGGIEDQPLLGTASFLWKGSEVTLVAVPTASGGPWFLFSDRTNGVDTYPAGRFLVGEADGGGVVLDFNRAYNPPCAFTSFATCPLPPRPNHLPSAIRAGERFEGAGRAHGAHHSGAR